MTDIFRHWFAVRSSDCLHDGSDQVMCCNEVGSCSLQEKQMLGRSVVAIINCRNGYGDRLSQSPRPSFAAPHERQPGLLERSLVHRPTAKRLGDVRMRPDITFGELPGCANKCIGEQAAHRQVNLSSCVVRVHVAIVAGPVLTGPAADRILGARSKRSWPRCAYG